MKETTVRLPEDMLDDLDAEADQQGMSRSAYIRHILSQRGAVAPTTAESLQEQIDEIREHIEMED